MIRLALISLLAVTACYGQSMPGDGDAAKSIPAPVETNDPPVWNDPPVVNCTEGVLSSIVIYATPGGSDFLVDPEDDSIILTDGAGCTFPVDVAIDDVNDEIDCGTGTTAGTTTGCTLLANDGNNSAVLSPTFSITISEPSMGGGGGYEDILDDMVGYADHYGVTGGTGRPLITVTNLNNSGSGSLRQAIADIGSGAWIRFSQGLSGVINLSSPLLLDGDANFTIDGRGADIIIDAATYSFRSTSASTNNFIIMYLEVRQGSVDTMNFDFAHDFWFYHVTVRGPHGDGGMDIRKTIGRFTLQEMFFVGGAKSILFLNDGYPGPLNDRFMEGTLYRMHFNTASRQPRGGNPNNIHMYNSYSHGMSERSVAWAHKYLDSDPGELLYENNIVNNDNGYPNYMSADGPALVTGKINVTGTLHLNGANPEENLPSQVFTPPYAYTAATATTALRDDIIATAGYQNVPFPGDP